MSDDYKDEIRERMGADPPQPKISLEEGEYPFDTLSDAQPKTARDGQRLLELREPRATVERMVRGGVTYTRASPKLFSSDDFIRVLSRYVGEDPDTVFESLVDRDFPEEDLAAMTVAESYKDALGPDGVDPTESPQFEKIRQDVETANTILDDWESGKGYYPVFWWGEGGYMLDGSHRAAVLLSEYPTSTVNVWVWEPETRQND